MLNDKILEFYSELREEVQDYVKTNGPSLLTQRLRHFSCHI